MSDLRDQLHARLDPIIAAPDGASTMDLVDILIAAWAELVDEHAALLARLDALEAVVAAARPLMDDARFHIALPRNELFDFRDRIDALRDALAALDARPEPPEPTPSADDGRPR